MSIQTRSQFYYGWTITDSNNKLDFSEGGGELQATLDVGDYSSAELIVEVKRVLDAVGALEYTVTMARATRIITIAATGTFELLPVTGTRIGQGPWSMLGFSLDKTGAATYDGDTGSGSSYRPQLKFQNYVSKENNKESTLAVVNEATDGSVEVVRFGTTQFYDMDITLITDYTMPAGHPIESNASALSEVRSFMNAAIEKGKMEFMPDRDDADTFDVVRLERTPQNRAGTAYRLRELYDRGMCGYFATGQLKWRVQ